ncbi:MAG TPA: hypothetical protein VJ436_05695 [Anaerolineales bacterium]|nr:hypothetical protein [Anaerolineales bacterium]
MDSVQRLTQAYSQAPWRKQVQLIVWFLLGLIMVALVAGIYLSVTARAATYGRRIQEIHVAMEAIEREIEDLETQLAESTSNREMEKRAKKLGFRPAGVEDMIFLAVPGYSRPDGVVLAPPPGLPVAPPGSLPAEYTESLFDWLRERVFEPAAPLIKDRP